MVNPWQEQLDKFQNIANIGLRYYSFLSPASLKLLNYSENATYLVYDREQKEKFILRVCRPGYHTKKEIESELIWMDSIAKNSDLIVPLSIKGDNGEAIQDVNFDGNMYYCTVFEFLEGDAPDEDKEEELIEQFEILGEITARLHEHSISHRDELNRLPRLSWDFAAILGEKPKWARWQDGVGLTPERKQLLQRVSDKIEERLEAFGKGPERYGLIHGDLRLANLLVDGKTIKIIDFDDCGFGWYLYDLATALSFIEHKDYVPELVEKWVKGYRKVRPLSEEEEQEIPTFIMMRRLQLISWIGSRDNETSRAMGAQYSIDTDPLAKAYLEKF